MANLELKPSNIQSGNAVIGTYKRGHIDLAITPVEEYVLIETGQIVSNTPKLIDLNVLDYEVRLLSVWVLSRQSPQTTTVKLDIIDCHDSSIVYATVSVQGNCGGEHSELPYLVTHKRYCYRITPTVNVDNILIFCKPVKQLDYVGIV